MLPNYWEKWSNVAGVNVYCIANNCICLGPGEKIKKQREQQDSRNPRLESLEKIFKTEMHTASAKDPYPDSNMLCLS